MGVDAGFVESLWELLRDCGEIVGRLWGAYYAAFLAFVGGWVGCGQEVDISPRSGRNDIPMRAKQYHLVCCNQ